VVSGRTPPSSAYFSFTNYLYTRFHPLGWKSNATLERRLVSCAPGPSRCEIFAGVNDPLNYLTVRTNGPSAFDATFSFILAADSASEAAVQAALAPEGAVNSIRFPGAIIQQGVTRGDEDELLNVMRVEGIVNEAERAAFYAAPPMRVWRVTPPPSLVVHESDMFASFEGRMRNRWTGVGEHAGTATMQELQTALVQLEKLVAARHGTGVLEKDYVSLNFTSFVVDSGYECLADGTQCQGDCRDTIYARATLLIQDSVCNATHTPCKPSRRSQLTGAADDALFVVGVNHQLTSHSVYSSLTAYNFPKLASGLLQDARGVLKYTQMESDVALHGSADKYFSTGSAMSQYLYVVKFARDCSAETFDLCLEVKADPTNSSELVIPLSSPVVILERMYINTQTASGPAVNETILPKLLHFRRSN
jgi:hypothetical protein